MAMLGALLAKSLPGSIANFWRPQRRSRRERQAKGGFACIVQVSLVLGGLSAAASAQLPPLQEQAGSTIGYASPAEALRALSKRLEVSITTQGGWIIADDKASHALWSFTPADNPASPAVVKRQITVEGSKLLVKMDVLCGGTKVACDKLVRDFQQLNDALKQKAATRPGSLQ